MISGQLANWLINEDSGSSIIDSGNNSINGILRGTPDWQNSVLTFDGISNDIYMPDNAIFDVSNWTFSALIKPNMAISQNNSVLEYGWIVCEGDNRGLAIRHVSANEDWLLFYFREQNSWINTIATGLNLHDGLEHAVAASYDGSTMRIYVDGTEVKNAAQTVPVVYNSGVNGFRIGSMNGARWFKGEIRNVHDYDRALSLAEVSSIYGKSIVSVSSNINKVGQNFTLSLSAGFSENNKEITDEHGNSIIVVSQSATEIVATTPVLHTQTTRKNRYNTPITFTLSDGNENFNFDLTVEPIAEDFSGVLNTTNFPVGSLFYGIQNLDIGDNTYVDVLGTSNMEVVANTGFFSKAVPGDQANIYIFSVDEDLWKGPFLRTIGGTDNSVPGSEGSSHINTTNLQWFLYESSVWVDQGNLNTPTVLKAFLTHLYVGVGLLPTSAPVLSEGAIHINDVTMHWWEYTSSAWVDGGDINTPANLQAFLAALEAV